MGVDYQYPFVDTDEFKAYIEEPELDEASEELAELQIIPAVSAAIEAYTGRELYKRDHDDKIDGSGRQKLQLDHYPIVSGESFTLTDRRSSSTYGDASYTGAWTYETDYIIDYGAGQIIKTSGVWAKLLRYFRVQYTAGHNFAADEPSPQVVTLKQAALKWAAIEFEKIKNKVHAAESVIRGDEVVNIKSSEVPTEVKGMIKHLRRVF